jgi:hypothetical protein
MAYYVRITKTEDGERSAKYQFTSDGTNVGRLVIDKETGNVEILEPAPGDVSGAIAARASAKLRKEWKAGKFPDLTEWAS